MNVVSIFWRTRSSLRSLGRLFNPQPPIDSGSYICYSRRSPYHARQGGKLIEIQIASIEALPGTLIAKTKNGYRFGVVYRLIDGTAQGAWHFTHTVKEARADLAALPRTPDLPTYAGYTDDEDEDFYYTRVARG